MRSRRILAVLLLVSTVVVHPIDSFGRLGRLCGAGGSLRAATRAWDRNAGRSASGFSVERRTSATSASRWATTPNNSAVAEEARPPATGAGEGRSSKGRADETSRGSRPAAKQGGRGGRGGGGGRGRKGQSGWRKKGDYAKKEGLLHQMKWPKTRRKALITMWESDLVLKREEYSALLTAACQLGWTAMASTIMEEMVASGVPVTTATYDAAIKAACKANKDRLALLLIVDQYARWQAEKLEDKAALSVKGIGEGGKAAIAAGKGGGAGGGGGSGGGGTGKGLGKSHFRTNLAKVLQVTSRTGDLEGSLEVLKYMSAMGISANPAVCQHLLATACKAGREHTSRVPAILRAMGDCGLRPDMSLLDALEMLFDVDSPEVALDLVLEVAKIGREKRGIGKIWRFDTNASAAEAFSFVLKRAEKMGRSDVVGMTIHAVLSDFPRSLYFGRARPASAGAGAGVGAAEAMSGGALAGDGATVRRQERPWSSGDDINPTDDDQEEENDEDNEEDDDDDEEDGTAGSGVEFGTGSGAGAGGTGTVGGVSASKLSSAVSGALTGRRTGKGKGQAHEEGGGGGPAGSGGGGAGASQQPRQKGKKWSRLGQKDLNRQRRTEAIHGVSVLNHILADLVNSPRSGHTAAGVLDRWRSITLGGGWAGGLDARDERGAAAATAEIVRYSRPTAASYMLTMSALVQSGQWGRARSLLEVMEVDGVPPSIECYSHLLTLLHTRLAASSRLAPDPRSHKEVEPEEPLLSPPVMGDVVGDVGGDVVSPVFLWSEPTYEWDEVLSLIADARSTERGKYGLTEEMYLTALDVLQIVSQRPEHVSLGVVGPAAPLPPPPANVFLDRAECLLEWALDAGMEMTVDLLSPVLILSHTARESRKVFQYFEAMLDTAAQPRRGTSSATFAEAYNMALHACEFGGEPERALAYLRTMGSATGFKPQATQYEAAINAMVAAGRFRDAYQLLAEAVENDVERVGVYDAALKACALEGNPAQAETLIRVMLETGCSPGSTAMSQLLLAYGNSGDVEGIQSVMARAANEVFTGGVMNALVYESVLGVLAPLEAWQDAETLVKEGETVLPGSLTYRTYGYLMVAYAVEKQWGGVIELALGTGRWPEKTSGGPEGRFHPPELRETTCAVALKWLLTQGVDGIDSVAYGGGGGRGVGHGDGGEQQAEAMERALEYRRCGRELFTRLLASGAPLRSVRVIKAALGGIGAEPVPASAVASSDPAEGSEDAPIYWKQTMPFWGDPEKPSSPTPASAAAAKGWKPLAAEKDWLLSVLPEEDAEREVEAQASHVGTVVEVFLRLYSTCEQPGANGLHSPTAVGLLQQAVSAACLADDPDLADRLLTAWLDRASLTQLSQARLRSALRISLSEVLAAFFAEGQGEEGVYRGLSLIGRCRDAGLPPYPFDFLGAMRACNTAGLYSTALRLFDQLTAASEYPEKYPESDPDFPNDDNEDDEDKTEEGPSDDSESFDSDVNSGSVDGSGAGISASPSPESRKRSQQQFQQGRNREDEGGMGGDREEEAGIRAGERGAAATPAVREKSPAEGVAAAATARDDDGGRKNRDRSMGRSRSNNRGRSNGNSQDEGADGGDGGRERSGEGDPGMRFENLNDIPDGELIPAAAAGIALESCFLGGRRDQAMEIVWRLIRRRHPLTEACRNRAIVALTSGGHPDMALDMARGMEKDQHYADRATVEFVERFQKRAFDAAAAADLARQQQHQSEEESLDSQDQDSADWADDDDEEEEEEEEGEEGEENVGGFAADAGAGEFDVDELVSLSRLSPSQAARGSGGDGGRSSDCPSELVLRFLPLLSEALRSKLRPGEGNPAPPINGAAVGAEKEDAVDAETDRRIL